MTQTVLTTGANSGIGLATRYPPSPMNSSGLVKSVLVQVAAAEQGAVKSSSPGDRHLTT